MLKELTFKLRDGRELVLSADDARALYGELHRLFAVPAYPWPVGPTIWPIISVPEKLDPYNPYVITARTTDTFIGYGDTA